MSGGRFAAQQEFKDDRGKFRRIWLLRDLALLSVFGTWGACLPGRFANLGKCNKSTQPAFAGLSPLCRSQLFQVRLFCANVQPRVFYHNRTLTAYGI